MISSIQTIQSVDQQVEERPPLGEVETIDRQSGRSRNHSRCNVDEDRQWRCPCTRSYGHHTMNQSSCNRVRQRRHEDHPPSHERLPEEPKWRFA